MTPRELQLLEALEEYAVQKDEHGIQSHCLICGAHSRMNAKLGLMLLAHAPTCLLYEVVDIKEVGEHGT